MIITLLGSGIGENKGIKCDKYMNDRTGNTIVVSGFVCAWNCPGYDKIGILLGVYFI